jgi:hypothetical protein
VSNPGSDGPCSKFSLNNPLGAGRPADRQPAIVLATAYLPRQGETGTAATFQSHPFRDFGERHCVVVNSKRIAVVRLLSVPLRCPQLNKEIIVPSPVRCIYRRQIARERSSGTVFRSCHRIDDMSFDRLPATPKASGS